jgi:RNA-binding protein
MSAGPLTGPQLRQLKSRAHHLNPIVHIGKAGITEALLASLNQALFDHELVKVRFEAFKDQKKVMAADLAERTGSRIVQQVGHMVVLFKGQPGPVESQNVTPTSSTAWRPDARRRLKAAPGATGVHGGTGLANSRGRRQDGPC